jgi:hypothetical protein
MCRNDGYWEPRVLRPTGRGEHCGECEYNYLGEKSWKLANYQEY